MCMMNGGDGATRVKLSFCVVFPLIIVILTPSSSWRMLLLCFPSPPSATVTCFIFYHAWMQLLQLDAQMHPQVVAIPLRICINIKYKHDQSSVRLKLCNLGLTTILFYYWIKMITITQPNFIIFYIYLYGDEQTLYGAFIILYDQQFV